MTSDQHAPDNYSPDLGDWRTANALWILGQDGVQLPSPLAARQISTYTEPGRQYSFVTPSAAALHLNIAWRAAGDATRLQKAVAWASGTQAPYQMAFSVDGAGAAELFDFFEALIVTAMSSFAAVEAFCNGVIVDHSTGPLNVKRKKGKIETLSPEEVERGVSTDDKLKYHLPGLMGVPSPCGKGIWDAFVKLKGLRDAFTHFKRRDQARHVDRSHEPTALLQSYRTDPYSLPEAAQALIRHFYAVDALPRWMLNPGWKRP